MSNSPSTRSSPGRRLRDAWTAEPIMIPGVFNALIAKIAEQLGHDADADRRIRHVENRPEVDVDEVGHRAEDEPVEPVADRPTQDQPEHHPAPEAGGGASHVNHEGDRHHDRGNEEDARAGWNQAESGSRVAHVGDPHVVADDRYLGPKRDRRRDQALRHLVQDEHDERNQAEGDPAGG